MRLSRVLALAIASIGLGACNSPPQWPEPAEQTEQSDFAVGSHGGRLLQQGDVAVELTIFEGEDIPPQFRAYVTRAGKPLAPQEGTLEVTLTRLDGEINQFAFQPQDDYFSADGIVAEPHSFDVDVRLRIGDQTHRWQYANPEGRLKLSAADASARGVTVEEAGPQRLRLTRDIAGAVAAGATPTLVFNVNRADLSVIQVGQAVEVATLDGQPIGRATVAHIKPPFEEGSRATTMTVSLPNSAAALPSGTALRGRVLLGEFDAPLAVRTLALQHFRNSKVVMARFGETYEVRMVEIGRQTPEWTEVKSGLKPGTRYVTDNVFVLGAQLDKNSAAVVHGH